MVDGWVKLNGGVDVEMDCEGETNGRMIDKYSPAISHRLRLFETK